MQIRCFMTVYGGIGQMNLQMSVAGKQLEELWGGRGVDFEVYEERQVVPRT